jgi:hypothetical protein
MEAMTQLGSGAVTVCVSYKRDQLDLSRTGKGTLLLSLRLALEQLCCGQHPTVMGQTDQHPFGSGSAFSPDLKTTKAQMVLDSSKSALCAGLSAPIKPLEQGTQKALFHQPALPPLPVGVTASTRVESHGVGTSLRPTQHQESFVGFNPRNLLGIVIAFIHQHRHRSGGKSIGVCRSTFTKRSAMDPASYPTSPLNVKPDSP